jgi:beta-glucanase (GH16 family)
LRIEASKTAAGRWQSGLLASADATGAGFSQQFGYFEMRAKLPSGPGLWPAFWLVSNKPVGPPVEIDILEHYGAFPASYESTLHVWNRPGQDKDWSRKNVNMVPAGSLYADFHTYGALVDPQQIVIYLDRKPVWHIATPPEHKGPLLVLLNLALGGGWPIKDAPSPSFMLVDYVRAYQATGR